MKAKLKMVRALRQGSYDGFRRRAGAIFPVAADADEKWFEDIGPAPEGTEIAPQLQNAQAPAGRSFIDTMKRLGAGAVPSAEAPKEMTLAEAGASGAVLKPTMPRPTMPYPGVGPGNAKVANAPDDNSDLT